jgi:Fe-S-cluster-containing dehydrogenase component
LFSFLERRREMNQDIEKDDLIKGALNRIDLNPSWSRRDFLRWSGVTVVGITALWTLRATAAEAPLIIMDQAEGIVIADPTKCVGCRRCELACTEFNDGKASPTTSRIKVSRNLNFGVKGIPGGQRGEGNWGNGLVIQDLCKQCPHPVPCANACPNDAIVVKPPTNARVVDSKKCVGCKMCQRACPWEMMSFDPDTNKATKCFLCDGKPKCVEACPAEALNYVAWRDLTDKVPTRIVPTAVIPAEKAATCNDCHKK